MTTPMHILIVDDDTEDREMIRDAYVTHHPDAAYIFIENGDQLMEYLQQQSEPGQLPALIMLDLSMPGKDGREALQEIKADFRLRQVPIVVFTTSSSDRDRHFAYDLGANCFITKPSTFQKLVELTEAICKLWLIEN